MYTYCSFFKSGQQEIGVDDKIIDALARGICAYDWRMTDEGFVPDAPCKELCGFCLDQAKYLIDIVKKEQM
jgi:hypothetical protein